MRFLRTMFVAIAVFGFLTMMTFFPLLPAVSGQTQNSQPSSQTSYSLTVQAHMTPVYDAFGLGVTEVDAVLKADSLHLNGSIPVELVSNFNPTRVFATVLQGGTNRTIAVAVSSGKYGANFGYDFVIPTNTTSLNVAIKGSLGGTSFLWRYVAKVPSLYVTGLPVLTPPASVALPSGSIVSQVFDSKGNTLSNSIITPTSQGGSQSTYSVPTSASLIILEPRLFVPAAIAVTITALFLIAIAALNLLKGGHELLGRVVGRVRALRIPGTSADKSPRPRVRIRFRSLFQPRKLLTLFLLCAVFMATLAVVAGPDPRFKAYVVADPVNVGQIQRSLAGIAGNTLVLTPAQDYSDFATMSSVGEFKMAVISNYPSLALPLVSEYVLAGLQDVPVIVVDNTADHGFVTQIKVLYGDKVVPVGNAANLNQTEQQEIATVLRSNVRTNVLGLQVGGSGFELVLMVEAFLSFLLIFLGWAFLGSLVSESGLQTDLSHLATIVSSGVFVFFFSEVMYVVTSSLLAVPLSLHAVLSGAQNVTAVGLLGFGGGSTPRLAAGFLGVLVGVLAVEGGSRWRWSDFALVLGVLLVLLANPFFVGDFTFQGLLLFVGNYAFGTAYASSQYLKLFIYGVGTILGGGINSTYLMSAGKMLFFAGLVPLAYLKRMSRTTTALAVLLAAVLIGDGGVRVGEMTPTKTVIAVVPGLFVGFAFAAVLVGLALIEKYVRGNWRS